MKITLILTFIISSISFSAYSCECIILPITNENSEDNQDQYIKRGFKDADFIFYGKIIGFSDKEIDGYSQMFGSENVDNSKELTNGYFPNFDIIKIYKGKKLNLSNYEIQIYQEWSNCDMEFEKDKEYVVFGYLDKEGKLKTSMCAPNLMINSKIDLKKILKYSN